MSIILHPKRWTNQPPAGAQINFGHPLAKGLTFYVLSNAGAGIQQALLPPGLPGHVVGTQPSPSWQTGGPGSGGGTGTGVKFTGNNQWFTWYERGPWVEPANGITFVSRNKRIGTLANTDTIILNKNFNDANSNPFLSYRLDANPSTSAGQDNLAIIITTGGTFHFSSVFNAGSGATLLEHTHAGTYDGANMRQYYNGILRTTDALTGSISYDTSTGGRFGIGGERTSGVQNNEYNGVIYYTAVWNRPMSASEMEWLHNEPYAMLVPNKQKKFFLAPAGSRAYTFNIAAIKLI